MIAVIPNKNKNTINDLIDSSDIEFQHQPNLINWLKQIDKRSRNAARSRGNLPTLSKKCHLDEDVPDTLLKSIPII